MTGFLAIWGFITAVFALGASVIGAIWFIWDYKTTRSFNARYWELELRVCRLERKEEDRERKAVK